MSIEQLITYILPVMIALMGVYLKYLNKQEKQSQEKFREENKKEHLKLFEWMGMGRKREDLIKQLRQLANYWLAKLSEEHRPIAANVVDGLILRNDSILRLYNLNMGDIVEIEKYLRDGYFSISKEVNENIKTIPIVLLRSESGKKAVEKYIDKFRNIILDIDNNKESRSIQLTSKFIEQYILGIINMQNKIKEVSG